MRQDRSIISIAALVLLMASMAQADDVLLRGSTIVLEGCEVLSVRGGEVMFTVPGGRRMQYPAEDVTAIVFDGLDELDRAEAALLEADDERAVKWFVLALVKAEDDVARLWIHARLAQTHNAAQQYVLAAGHAAAVFTHDDHPAWKRLVPICPPDRPALPAAEEALARLQAARRAVRSRELLRLVDDMTREVRRIRDTVAETWDGPLVPADRTISGHDVSDLVSLRASLNDDARTDSPVERRVLAIPVAESGTIEPVTPDSPAPASVVDVASSDAGDADIEDMIEAGRFTLALDRCRARLRTATGDRAAALLHLTGRAQLGLDRPREAAVSFTRAALLHPDAPVAAACLLEAAQLHLEVYGRPDVAQRLAGMALERAERRGDDMIAARAHALLDLLRGRS